VAVDLLAFGPHPDDVEIGMGGTIARHAAAGRAVGLCDLTAGELGSNGTPAGRRAEADAAARVLGAAWRDNLGWPDGELAPVPALVRAVAALIRRHQPRTIALPYWEDRHPDHAGASRAIVEATYKSGLRRYEADLGGPWRPDWLCYYFINDHVRPSFAIDVSAFYDRKREALACHRSQFEPAGGDVVPTRLNTPLFRQRIESRDAGFGAELGVAFAEGFVVRTLLERTSLLRDVDGKSQGPA
jgi:bacillithiol biosynthesis deacetylase BshB1